MKTVAFIRSTGIYNDSRATKEIFALAENGFQVIVLGWNRDGNANERCCDVFQSVISRVDFHFFNEQLPNGSGIKGIGSYALWFRWIYKELAETSKRLSIDIIHSCDFDTGMVAYEFCKKHHVKMVYDVYDYYVDAHILPSALSCIVENQEIRVLNGADAVIICTEERREQISKSNPQNIFVIYNSPEIENTESVFPIFDYVYCGVLSGQRLVGEVFDGYSNNSDLKFTFAGYGHYAEQARDLQKEYSNFSFKEAIPYSQVLELESQAKVLAALYEPTIRNHRLCAPNKFYEALALGKPVIVCKGTGIDKIVEANNIGIAIDYEAEEFYSALRRLISSPELRSEMGARARKLYDDQYSWVKMKKRLVELYSEL